MRRETERDRETEEQKDRDLLSREFCLVTFDN